MKISLLSTISLASLAATTSFAANLNLIGGGTDMSPDSLSGLYDKIVIAEGTGGFAGNSQSGSAKRNHDLFDGNRNQCTGILDSIVEWTILP